MPEVVFSVDQSKSMAEQAVPGHNRWHPDIPAAASVRPGSEFRVECREWTDAQITTTTPPTTCATSTSTARTCSPARSRSRAPSRATCWSSTSSTSGPAPAGGGRRARPGLGLHRASSPRTNGGGFLTDHYPGVRKAIWDFHGQEATSRHIPGVRYTGITHPGLFGTAPSADLLAEWNRREQALIDTTRSACRRWRCRRWSTSTLAGTLSGGALDEGRARGRAHGARRVRTAATTTSRTSRVAAASTTRCTWTGANLSGGDLHFSQGDGEITFCGAIEMGGFIDFGVDLIKDGMNKYAVHDEPDLHAGPRRAALLGVPDVHRDLGRRGRREPLPRRHDRLPAGVPERDRLPEDVRLHRRAGVPAARVGADRGPDLRASSTSRTRAARCTCPRRSSTSTSGRPRTGRRRRDRGTSALTS